MTTILSSFQWKVRTFCIFSTGKTDHCNVEQKQHKLVLFFIVPYLSISTWHWRWLLQKAHFLYNFLTQSQSRPCPSGGNSVGMGQRAHGTQRPRCNAIATTTTAGGIDTQLRLGGKLNQSWFTNTWNYRNHIHCTGITRVMLNATWKKCRLNDWTIGQTYALLLLRQSERRGGKLWKSRCQDRESGMLEIHLLCRCCAFNSPRSGLFISSKEV